MNEFIKLAALEINNSNDVIKTAGILRLLKNKLFALFDNDKATEVAKLLNNTSDIKPILSETYKLIKNVESAINDLDVSAYNANIDALKEKINQLNSSITNLNVFLPDTSEKTNEEPSVEIKSIKEPVETKEIKEEPSIKEEEIKWQRNINPNLERQRVENLTQRDYKIGETLSAIGVTSKDIKINSESEKAFKANLAKLIMPQTEEEEKWTLQEEDKISLENLKTTFYDKIPQMEIIKIEGRELSAVDHKLFGRKGEKKPGAAEITVDSDMEQLQAPADNWHIKMRIKLVDKRKLDIDPFDFVIYLQSPFIARDDATQKTFTSAGVRAKRKKENK